MAEGETKRRWRSWPNVIGMISGIGTLAAILAGRVGSRPVLITVSVIAVFLIGFSTVFQVDSSRSDDATRAGLLGAGQLLPPHVKTPPSVLVSFHPSNRDWARWIVDQLDAWGYLAHRGRWEERSTAAESYGLPDAASEDSDDDLTRVAKEQLRGIDCVLVLISRAYVAARREGHSWQTALPQLANELAADDSLPVILPVLVESFDMDADTRSLIAINLTNPDAEEWREALLDRLRREQLPAPRPNAIAVGSPLPGRGPAIAKLRAADADFVGRRGQIDELHRLLHPAQDLRATRSAELNAVVIHGLGGVGKSKLALQYAWDYASEYDLVWWVGASTPVSAINDLIELAKALGLEEKANHDETVNHLWSTLRQRDRWLLVFDDVDDPKSIRASSYWPATKRGHVLITSRVATGWDSRASHTLRLDPLTAEEAEEFVTQRIPEAAGDPQTLRWLVERLGRLPISLVQVTTLIRETGTTLSAFCERLRDHPDEVIAASQLNSSEVAGGYSLLLIMHARQGAPAAREMLAFLSMFDSENIPRQIITDHADVLPAQLSAVMTDERAWGQMISQLRRFSLIEAMSDRFDVHSQVQSAVRNALSLEEQQLWRATAIRLLLRAFPRHPEEPSAWSACAFLMPHVQEATDVLHRLRIKDEQTARLLLLAGIYLHGRCEWRQAQDYLRGALTIREELYGANDLRVAECLYHLGQSQFPLAQLQQARDSAERALAIRERLLDPMHPLIARALIRLAEILREFADRNEEAVACTRRAERILREVGANEDGIADALLIRGTILRNAGRLGEALRAQRQALALNERVRAKGPSAIEAAVNHVNIGVVHRDLGQWDEARDELETAIAIMEPALPAGHLEVAQARKYLGDIYRRTGELAAAHRLLTQVTEIHEARQRDEEHKLASCLAKLGSIQLALGEKARAKETLERAYRIYREKYPDGHPYLAKALSRLAPVYMALGEEEKAMGALLQAQRILEERYGCDHPALVWILQSLAEISQAHDDRVTANTLRARAAQIRQLAVA